MRYILAGLMLIVCYGIYVIVRDMNRFIIVPYEVKSKKIKKKYTVVMLSDLHNKSYGRQNEKLAKAIADCHPDCIVTAGDMYTSKAGTGFDNALALLGALSEQFPVYVANGNHEHKTSDHPDAFGHMYEKYTRRLRALGIDRKSVV